jgi:hypothetical protein
MPVRFATLYRYDVLAAKDKVLIRSRRARLVQALRKIARL